MSLGLPAREEKMQAGSLHHNLRLRNFTADAGREACTTIKGSVFSLKVEVSCRLWGKLVLNYTCFSHMI